MLTILLFSLVFAHNNLSRKDPRDYICHVKNASEIPGSVRSLNIILQAPGIAATKGKLSGTQKVITLECFSLQSPMPVHLLYLEKMHRDVTNQTAEKCTLQSLKVTTSANRKPATSHSCALLTHRIKKFQRKIILKVFLAGISNCVVTAKLPKLKVFADGLTVPHVHQENKTLEDEIESTYDKDMQMRINLSIVMKVFIVCILLAIAIPYIVFVVCEIPCPCTCPDWITRIWRRISSVCAACVPVSHQRRTRLALLLKGREQKPLGVFV